MKNAPCIRCENRRVGCHSECELYQSYKTEREIKRKAVLKKKVEQEMIDKAQYGSLRKDGGRHYH